MPTKNSSNKIQKKLYFIAVIPPPDLREQVKALKEEMKRKFDAIKALKSPAHITLQMPFKRRPEEEKQMIAALKRFSLQQNPFRVELSGFDNFPPRVIFIKVSNHQPILSLHKALQRELVDQLDFEIKEVSHAFHPHMTIATRDLKKEIFSQAWNAFESRPFHASFEAKSLFLLKHNGKFWDIYHEFSFRID